MGGREELQKKKSGLVPPTQGGKRFGKVEEERRRRRTPVMVYADDLQGRSAQMACTDTAAIYKERWYTATSGRRYTDDLHRWFTQRGCLHSWFAQSDSRYSFVVHNRVVVLRGRLLQADRESR